MGFKLGRERGNYAVGGEIKTKMRFGKQAGDIGSVPGTPIIRVPLDEGIMGEANKDGTIFISKKVEPGSSQETQILTHEIKHMVDLKTGRLRYDDYSLTWDGQTYERNKGKIYFEGRWLPEGSADFPWENH